MEGTTVKKRRSHKGIKILLCLLAVVLLYSFLGYYLSDRSAFAEADGASSGWSYVSSEWTQQAFVSTYKLNTLEGEMILTVPDQIGGFPVKGLGGFAGLDSGHIFGIEPPDDFRVEFGFAPGMLKTVKKLYPLATVRDVDVTVNIGAGVESVRNRARYGYYGSLETEEGTTEEVILLFHYYINCDENNKMFYSENGSLYERSTGRVVETFEEDDSSL